MKSYAVWLDVGITVDTDIDGDTDDGYDKIQKIAIKKFIELLKKDPYAEITYEELTHIEQGE